VKIVSVTPTSTGFTLKVDTNEGIVTTKTFWDNDGIDKVVIHDHTYEVVGLSRLVRLP
jgi:hypothetical protein